MFNGLDQFINPPKQLKMVHGREIYGLPSSICGNGTCEPQEISSV